MEDFSLRGAWSKGFAFFSWNIRGHVILLVGLGIALPVALQLLVIGEVTGWMSGPVPGMAAQDLPVLVATLGGYLLQLVSYFGSWRLGLGERGSVAGSALYGLVAGLAVAIGVGACLIVFALAINPLPQHGVPVPAILLGAIVFPIVFALIYTAMAALVAVGVLLVLVTAMLLGMASGQMGLAATMVGGSGLVVVMLILLAALMLWLAARFSCATCVMADRRSVNMFGAIAASWRLTWEEQWRIMGYLALIGFGLALIIFFGSLAAGYGIASTFGDSEAPELGIGATVIGVALGIPFAFLTVMIPAGIYRELVGPAAPTDVFA